VLDPLKGVEHDFILVRVVCGAAFFSAWGMSERVIGVRKRGVGKRRAQKNDGGRRTTTYPGTLRPSRLIKLDPDGVSVDAASTTGSSKGRTKHRRRVRHDDDGGILKIRFLDSIDKKPVVVGVVVLSGGRGRAS